MNVPTPVKSPMLTPIISAKKTGQRLVINSPKNGILAYGYLLENEEFIV